MVTWSALCGVLAVPDRRSSTPAMALALAAFCACTLSAQESTPPPNGGTGVPASPPNAVSPAPVPPAASPQAPGDAAKPPIAATTYGRVVVEAAALRCWPGAVAQPPVFEESLKKDQVVVVGRVENGFRAIVVPLGPLGYVSRKFTELGADGQLKTKGAKVSFRFRPRSSEPPVSQLADGTALHVIGEQDDWYRVRVPGVDAWVAEAEVQLADQTDPTLATSYLAWQQQNEAAVKARLEQIAAKAAQQAQDVVDLAAVQVVQDAFALELKKPLAEQNYAPLYEALDKLLPTLAAESGGRVAIDTLKKRMETQRWIAEATAARDSRPPVVETPAVDRKDPLEAFQASGWLRYENRLAAVGFYYLEKGGQRLCLLTCDTGRYDLAHFVGREISVNGPRRRPATDSLSVVDAERIRVLGTAAR